MSSNHGNSGAEETPSMDRIVRALKVVLFEFELDQGKVGTTQRLQYEEFELISYHLFLMIDPHETKRRFRSVCAARNPEERSKFIELAVRFINDKQLMPQRVTTGQLRILGGEPFRRLLDSLIKVACSSELDRSGLPEPDTDDSSALLLARRVQEESAKLRESMQRFRDSQEQLRELRKRTEDSARLTHDRWLGLAARNNVDVTGGSGGQFLPGEEEVVEVEEEEEEEPSTSSAISQSTGGDNTQTSKVFDFSPVVRALLARLEKSHARQKVAMQKIRSIELPREVTTDANDSAVKKRLSQFIRETANRFTSKDLQEIPPEVHRNKLNEQYRQQLIAYDEGVEGLVRMWRQEEDRRDEELLREPKMRAMYAELERLLPKIELTPIGAQPEVFEAKRRDHSPAPSLEFIKEMFALFPDERYDDQEILEHAKKFFTQNKAT